MPDSELPPDHPTQPDAGTSRRTVLAALGLGSAGALLPVNLAAAAQRAASAGPASAAVSPSAPTVATAPPSLVDPDWELGAPEKAPSSLLPSADKTPPAARAGAVAGQGAMTRLPTASSAQALVAPLNVVALPADRRPYHLGSPVTLPDQGVHDSTGVRMVSLGGRLYDHPVAQAQFGLILLESHRLTGDVRYLNLALLQANRLVARRTLQSGAWWYPYPFRYAVHRYYDLHVPPWYSMMAQGQALSLFVRLFEVTANPAWKTAADATYTSFTQAPAVGRSWGVWTSGGLLWLEEYPSQRAISGDRTYNGHTFSAYGLYDYWVLTRSTRVLSLLQAALTTTRDAFGLIRRRGWRSYYCCAHRLDAGSYHTTHILQHLQVYALTGDRSFADIADLLYTDHAVQVRPGVVRFSTGTHRGYQFSDSGAVTATTSLTLTRPSLAPTSDRERVLNQPGYWYRITAGHFAGYLVQEYPGARYYRGACATILYPIARVARTLVANPKAYRLGADGLLEAVATDLALGARVDVDARAVVNGVEHLRVAAGPYAGLWMGRASVAVAPA